MQSNKNKQDSKQPAFLQAAFLFVFIAALLIVLFKLGFYRCPSEYVLGIPCPLCGISRAFKAVLAGDLQAAFYYHPLWPVILLSGILYLLFAFNIIRPGKKVFNICCIILGAMLFACFILRHIYGSPVVRIHFDDSFAGRFLAFLRML